MLSQDFLLEGDDIGLLVLFICYLFVGFCWLNWGNCWKCWGERSLRCFFSTGEDWQMFEERFRAGSAKPVGMATHRLDRYPPVIKHGNGHSIHSWCFYYPLVSVNSSTLKITHKLCGFTKKNFQILSGRVYVNLLESIPFMCHHYPYKTI